jgi:hypothetical protein
VKGSAGPVEGELEVSSSEPHGSPVSTAIAILVLVTAAALAAVAVGVAGWLADLPAVATGLGAWSAFALTFGAGLYITYWKPDTSTRNFARRGQPVSHDGWLAGPGQARTLVKPEPHCDRGPSVAVRGNADGACRPSEL